MRTITKNDLIRQGSAPTMNDLCHLIQERLYWAKIETRPSEQFSSKLGTCFDCVNGRGLLNDCLIIHETRTGRYVFNYVR